VSGLVDVLDEIQSVIETAYAGGDLDVQVERRFLFTPTPPAVDIYPGDPSRDDSTANFDDELGNAGYRITVRTRIATGDYGAAYDWLLETMDEESDLCLPLLFVDESLNGLAMDLDVRDASGLRAYEDVPGAGAYLGWQFTLLVLAAKS
jgi:hypothetical protein